MDRLLGLEDRGVEGSAAGRTARAGRRGGRMLWTGRQSVKEDGVAQCFGPDGLALDPHSDDPCARLG